MMNGRHSDESTATEESSHQRTSTIFVRHIPKDIAETSIIRIFEECGKVLDVRIPRSMEGGNKQYCFIKFDTSEAADQAVAKLHQDFIGSMQITVELFYPRKVETDTHIADPRGGDSDSDDGSKRHYPRDRSPPHHSNPESSPSRRQHGRSDSSKYEYSYSASRYYYHHHHRSDGSGHHSDGHPSAGRAHRSYRYDY